MQQFREVKEYVTSTGLATTVKLMMRTFKTCMLLMRMTDGKTGATLGKVYGYMCVLDKLYRNPIGGMSRCMREKIHTIFMARWQYFHIPLMNASYMVDPEYIAQEHTPNEIKEFRNVMRQMATDDHSYANILMQYGTLRQRMELNAEDFKDDTPWTLSLIHI